MRDRRLSTQSVDALAEARTRIHDDTTRSTIQVLPDRDIIGVLAEDAFERLSGLPMDRRAKKSGDDGADFLTAGGLRVDIKATPEPNGRLMVKMQRAGKAHIYVLAIVNRETRQVTFKGWAYQNDFAPEKKHEKHHGVTFCAIEQKDLRPMELGPWRFSDEPPF